MCFLEEHQATGKQLVNNYVHVCLWCSKVIASLEMKVYKLRDPRIRRAERNEASHAIVESSRTMEPKP